MKRILFDCDSTVGLPKKPMDDALALLYLLGCPDEAEVCGITCTFGNGTVQEVVSSTQVLLKQIGRQDIPLLTGAEADQDPRSEAARFIVETVNRDPGHITLVGIGSLTNLYGAYLLDPDVFQKTAQIVLMGGYSAPLLYHGRHLDELNFSVNPAAAAAVLQHGKNVSILTGNNTLEPSWLPQEEFMRELNQLADPFIARTCGYRFDDKKQLRGAAVSYCWDVVATVYLLHPELFQDDWQHCYITDKGMHSGWLGVTQAAPDTVCLNLPQVKDLQKYREEMYRGWKNFRVRDNQ